MTYEFRSEIFSYARDRTDVSIEPSGPSGFAGAGLTALQKAAGRFTVHEPRAGKEQLSYSYQPRPMSEIARLVEWAAWFLSDCWALEDELDSPSESEVLLALLQIDTLEAETSLDPFLLQPWRRTLDIFEDWPDTMPEWFWADSLTGEHACPSPKDEPLGVIPGNLLAALGIAKLDCSLAAWERRDDDRAIRGLGIAWNCATLAASLNAYRYDSFFTKRSSSLAARDRARKRHQQDPKQAAKRFVQDCWQAWQSVPLMYRSKAAFALDMIDKQPELQSPQVIERWCRSWEKAAKLSG